MPFVRQPAVASALESGQSALANSLLRQSDLGMSEPRVPLRLAVCEECRLLQITDLVPPDDLFSHYLYFSSFSDAMLQHAKTAALRYVEEYALGAESLVVEVASNDGYLLKNFVSAGVPCLGIEPAQNIAVKAVENGIPTICEFFTEESARKTALAHGQADLILGNNVFAHAPFINDFVAGLAALLKSGGRIILEFPYGCEFIEKTEFDTIYHEHVFYFTLSALIPVFARHGLEIFHTEHLSIHGGSLRLFAGHRGDHPIRASADNLKAEEAAKGVNSLAYYEGFARRVESLKSDLLALLHELKAGGKTIAAYGASAKGSTLLNYYGIGADLIDFVVDRSTVKQGLYTPGSRLPICGPEELQHRQPDYALLLTWNFASEILAQQEWYRAKGGKFIIPIPAVSIV